MKNIVSETKLSRLPFYAFAPVAAGVIGVVLESSNQSTGVTAGAVIIAVVLLRLGICYLSREEDRDEKRPWEQVSVEMVNHRHHERTQKAAAG